MTTHLRLDRGSYAAEININNLSVPGVRLRQGWSPRVSRPNPSSLEPPFLDMVETIPLRATGTTEAQARAAVKEVAEAMYQAWRWRSGESIDPVVLEVQLDGSSLAAPLSAAVWGTPEDAGDLLSLPADYTFVDQVVVDFDLPLQRRGLLLEAEVDEGNTISATQPEFAVIASGDSDVKLPQVMNVKIDGFSSATFKQAYFFICHNGAIKGPSDVVDDTSTGTLSTPDDAANNALNDDIIRWAAGSTNFESVSWPAPAALATGVHQIGIVAAVRVNNSGRVWQMKARSEIGANGVVNSETRPVTIEYNGGEPQIVPLGSVFSAVDTHNIIRIFFRVDSASGGPTLDINYIALANMDTDGATLMHIFRDQAAAAASFDITFEHRQLSHITPAVIYDNGSGDIDTMSYDTPVIIRGALDLGSLRLCMMATNGASWRYTNSHTIGRLYRRGHLVPL